MINSIPIMLKNCFRLFTLPSRCTDEHVNTCRVIFLDSDVLSLLHNCGIRIIILKSKVFLISFCIVYFRLFCYILSRTDTFKVVWRHTSFHWGFLCNKTATNDVCTDTFIARLVVKYLDLVYLISNVLRWPILEFTVNLIKVVSCTTIHIFYILNSGC